MTENKAQNKQSRSWCLGVFLLIGFLLFLFLFFVSKLISPADASTPSEDNKEVNAALELTEVEQIVLDEAIEYLEEVQSSLSQGPLAVDNRYYIRDLQKRINNLEAIKKPTGSVSEVLKELTDIEKNYYPSGYNRRKYKKVMVKLDDLDAQNAHSITQKYGVSYEHLARHNPHDTYQEATITNGDTTIYRGEIKKSADVTILLYETIK